MQAQNRSGGRRARPAPPAGLRRRAPRGRREAPRGARARRARPPGGRRRRSSGRGRGAGLRRPQGRTWPACATRSALLPRSEGHPARARRARRAARPTGARSPRLPAPLAGIAAIALLALAAAELEAALRALPRSVPPLHLRVAAQTLLLDDRHAEKATRLGGHPRADLNERLQPGCCATWLHGSRGSVLNERLQPGCCATWLHGSRGSVLNERLQPGCCATWL